MAQEKPLTPEKQLLNIIEKPMAQSSLHAATIKYHGLSLFSLNALKGRFAFLRERFFKRKGLRQLDIKTLNYILEFCAIILTVYFTFDLSHSIINLKKDLVFNIRKDIVTQGAVSQIISPLKAASYYLEKARERDIFKMEAKKPISEAGVPTRGPSRAIIEATQYLRLVGISWSNDPDVMIEDTKNQRTLFLKKGQTIDNTIKIQGVSKDKVILSYKGEEIELR